MRTVIELNKILSIQKQLNMDSRKNEMIITNDFQEAALRVEESWIQIKITNDSK